MDATLGVMAERDTPRFNAFQDQLTRQALRAERPTLISGNSPKHSHRDKDSRKRSRPVSAGENVSGWTRARPALPDAERISAKELN